jgi:hypothetical protein
VGAARALVDPSVQAEIADRLTDENSYVSLAVHYEFRNEMEGEVKEVLFIV